MLGLDFSEFGYVTVWDIEKCWNLCFLLHKISNKQGKNDRVPTFLKKTQKKFGTQKNVGTPCLNFAEFGYVPYFFYVHLKTFSKFLDGHALQVCNIKFLAFNSKSKTETCIVSMPSGVSFLSVLNCIKINLFQIQCNS